MDPDNLWKPGSCIQNLLGSLVLGLDPVGTPGSGSYRKAWTWKWSRIRTRILQGSLDPVGKPGSVSGFCRATWIRILHESLDPGLMGSLDPYPVLIGQPGSGSCRKAWVREGNYVFVNKPHAYILLPEAISKGKTQEKISSKLSPNPF